MVEPLDRMRASTHRIPHPIEDKEAFAVLALNDAAAGSRKGRFYYLPESSEPPGIRRNQREPIVMKSIVPRLLYANYEWKHDEVENYVEMNDVDRYDHVQRRIHEELRQVDVVPINLVIQTLGMLSLSWPAKSMASIVIYGPGPWYKLSSMSDWTGKATKNHAGDTYKVSMYPTGSPGKTKALYMQTVNSVGELCGAEDIPLKLRAMLPLSVDKREETDIVALGAGAISQRAAVNARRECTWIPGVTVLNRLLLEAMERGGKAGFSTT